MSIPYKDIISRIVETPKDNRTISAKQFWKKETVLLKQLLNQFPDENFWLTLSLSDSRNKNGRVTSLAFFLDTKDLYWVKFLKKQWRRFNWVPDPIKSYKPQKNNPEQSSYTLKRKKTLRNLFK